MPNNSKGGRGSQNTDRDTKKGGSQNGKSRRGTNPNRNASSGKGKGNMGRMGSNKEEE